MAFDFGPFDVDISPLPRLIAGKELSLMAFGAGLQSGTARKGLLMQVLQRSNYHGGFVAFLAGEAPSHFIRQSRHVVAREPTLRASGPTLYA